MRNFENAMFVGGNTGEINVRNILMQTRYKVYHNIYIKDASGDIAQIDLLAVTDRAIICIEVKNYNKCVVLGSEFNKTWTICYRSNKRNQYNPILQNRKHIAMLKSVLGKKDIPVWNLVVFPNGCMMNIDEITDTRTKVISTEDLWYTLADLDSRDARLKADVKNEILTRLDEFEQQSFILAKQHRDKYF